MALPHQSIATISSPEFINLQPLDINPLMSKCEIKVLYLGENRNRSYISKETATEMAKTLRGAPIVGYYKQSKEDFRDHGQQVILQGNDIIFNCLTKPYGFVAPDARVWFQKFSDKDQFGNEIEREYLMTTGYLWTGQFEQAQKVLDQGKPQSMELDEKTLQGHWATNVKNNIEFFIINDAIFTKLCILGDDVEPCFEGASITSPSVSSSFSKEVDDNFKRTLFSMINELKDALKGGKEMGQEEKIPAENFEQGVSEPAASSELETTKSTSSFEAEVVNEQGNDEFEKKTHIQDDTIDNKKEPKAIHEADDKDKKEEQDEQEDKKDDKEDDDDDDKKKYSLLEEKYNDLSTKYQQLKEEYDSLVEFKNNIENEQKDALIQEFYMLSDEDKKDVIENKAKYSLDEIKAKLAVICFEKKVNFVSSNQDKIDDNIEQENIITYNLNNDSFNNLPDWVKAVKEYQDNI